MQLRYSGEGPRYEEGLDCYLENKNVMEIKNENMMQIKNKNKNKNYCGANIK